MFDSVEQLEMEVQEFQQNILASTEFVRSIEKIIAAIRAQEHDFATKSSELTINMDSDVKAFRTSQKEALSKLIAENKTLNDELTAKGNELLKELNTVSQEIELSNAGVIKDFRECISAQIENSNSVNTALQVQIESFAKKCDGFLQSASEINQTHLSQTSNIINESQQDYLLKIEESNTAINQCQEELNRKYEAFLVKLESTNIDQMFKVCQEIKKSMNTKILILSVGVGSTIALMIVSLFIR